MHGTIIKDLSKKKSADIFGLLTDFNRNARWAGYFFGGTEESILKQMQAHSNIPRHGYHITIWHKNNNALSIADFMRIVCDNDTATVTVEGYADDGKNQALAVSKPQLYIGAAQPHVTISWGERANAAASGYLQFGEKPIGCPDVLHNGQLKVIMHNNREMQLDGYRNAIVTLMKGRAQELGKMLSPAEKDILDKIYVDKLLGIKPIDAETIGEIKTQLESMGSGLNEGVATLYARYVVSSNDLSAQVNMDMPQAEPQVQDI